jgi:hypothetical protein
MKPKRQPKTVTPVPAPTEWQNGCIKLPGPPAKPIRGRGHERIRLLGSECPPNERSARKWFFLEVMYENTEHADRVSEGNSSPLFLSIEAYQLWSAHKEFWIQEHQSSLIQKKAAKKAAAQDATRKVNKSLKRAAATASFTAAELKAKMKRLKSLLKDDHGQPLALELIKAAEPWLLEALLAGVTLRKRGSLLEWTCGPFFKAFTYCFSGDPGLPFWLTVARAWAAGCCPKAFNIKNLFHLDLSARDATEMEIIINYVLPHLSALQELKLGVGTYGFSTASLPVMPLMSRLILENGDSDELSCVIRIESLDKQNSLKTCILQGFVSLQIDGDQEQLFERVRLETSQGSYQENSEGLRCIARPPETGCCIIGMNLPAARVLVRMCSDHSSNPAPPQWWNSGWANPDWWKKNGYDLDEHKTFFADRRLDLAELVSLDLEIAEVLASAHIPICIPARLLPPEILERFKTSKSEFHIAKMAGDDSLFARQLPGTAAPTLTIDVNGSLLPDVARAIAAFTGASLILNLSEGKLDEMAAAALSEFSGKLILIAPRYRDSEIDKKSAEKLTQKKGELLIEGDWRLEAETLEILGQRSDFDLGEYRLRRLEKWNGEKGIFWEVQLRFNHSIAGYELSVTKGKIGETGLPKVVPIQWVYNRDKLVKKLIEEGYQEIHPFIPTAAAPC